MQRGDTGLSPRPRHSPAQPPPFPTAFPGPEWGAPKFSTCSAQFATRTRPPALPWTPTLPVLLCELSPGHLLHQQEPVTDSRHQPQKMAHFPPPALWSVVKPASSRVGISLHNPLARTGPGKRIPLGIAALPCQSLPSHWYFGTGSGSGAGLTHPAAPNPHHPPEPSQEQRAVISEPQSSRANTAKAPATERAITGARPCRSPGRTRQCQQQTRRKQPLQRLPLGSSFSFFRGKK